MWIILSFVGEICLLSQIAVVMFPTLEEFKFRSDKRFKEMGKEVPADAVKKMLGSTTWNHELDCKEWSFGSI